MRLMDNFLKSIQELPFLYLTAAYAAIVSTLVLTWDIAKWKRAQARLKVSVESHSRPAASIKGEPATVTWSTINVRNIGSHTTTIKRIAIRKGKGPHKGKEENVNLHNYKNELPQILESGKQWDGYPSPWRGEFGALEVGDILLVYHSMSDDPAQLKLTMVWR